MGFGMLRWRALVLRASCALEFAFDFFGAEAAVAEGLAGGFGDLLE